MFLPNVAARILLTQAEAAPKHEVPLIFYFCALASMAWLAFNLRRLTAVQVGKPVEGKLEPIKQLYQALVMGVGQRRVFRDRFTYASIMHFMLGWGFIELFFATTVDFFTTNELFLDYLPGMDEPWFAALNDLGGIMLLTGTVMALYRRHANKPEPLPQDAFKGRGHLLGDTGILIFLVVIAVGGFIAEAARLAVDQPATASASWVGYPLSKALSVATWEAIKPFCWWSHALISLLFIAIIPLTKMFHVITVVANIALTNSERRGSLSVMNVSEMMEDPDLDYETVTFGANTVKDFGWKTLLDSVSCTECARCTSVCPAYATGKPLSPMHIITKIRDSLYAAKASGEDPAELVGGVITEDEIWSCTTCAACMDVCPVMIDHIPTFTELRRHQTLAQGNPPTQASKTLEATMNAGNPWGIPAERRLEWTEAIDVNVPVMGEKKEADVLFWVGCAGAFDPRNQKIAQSIAKIMDTADVDFAVLGSEESCTGDSARRMGEEYLFENMAKMNIETLGQYKFNKIVTGCPHCMHTLGNEYKDFGGNFEVVHHTQFINQLMQEGKINPKTKLEETVTYHDPCYLGRHNGVYDEPRDVLTKLTHNGKFVEVEQSGKDSFCCGAGGGNMWYEIDEGERINVTRFNQLAEVEPKTVCTSCSFCMIMMDDASKVTGKDEQIKIKDLAELVVESL